MNLEEFTKLLKDQYIDGEDITLTPDSEIREIESYDSLTGWTMMSEIMDKFSIDIDSEEWSKLRTVKEIYEFAISKKVE